MRTTLLATLAMHALAFTGVQSATGEELEPAEAKPAAELPAAEAAADSAKGDATSTLASADPPGAEDKLPVKLRPGFKPRKRGKFVVYCRKESVMGTRFPVEKCYDEQGIRDYLQAQRENQEQVDQMRRICGSQAACGAN